MTKTNPSVFQTCKPLRPDFLLMVLPLRGSVWLTLGVLPVVVRSAFAGAVVWLAPVTECLAVWLGRCRVRCALCLRPPRVLACMRPSPIPRPVCLRAVCLFLRNVVLPTTSRLPRRGTFSFTSKFVPGRMPP